ncbi:hypothetical protein BOVATA_008410 [Babesia ovata]|uniref:Uncharacterized protein n=1 Tax=Babesia ovata TaxID=189622 RepID=A0A2H6K8P1_9APIC|nr:uncharacterized protein BOVATA_008410 [Babesia ovata]GBE59348.1 hypothetical protein BOVATA_008410 [Babesia ovata]
MQCLVELSVDVTAAHLLAAGDQDVGVAVCESVAVERRQGSAAFYDGRAVTGVLTAVVAGGTEVRGAAVGRAVDVVQGVSQLLQQLPQLPCQVYHPGEAELCVFLREGVVGVQRQWLQEGGASTGCLTRRLGGETGEGIVP